MRRAVGALVRLAGLRVQSFPSAQEFLAFPRPDVPSCLVLDVQLPGLSGLDLQEELLLTREALEQYVEKLADGGVMVVNITNRSLDLEPVVANLAADAGLAGRLREESVGDISAEDRGKGKTPSRWVVLARSDEHLRTLGHDPKWRQLQGRAEVGVWTDDYSNLVRVIRWKK